MTNKLDLSNIYRAWHPTKKKKKVPISRSHRCHPDSSHAVWQSTLNYLYKDPKSFRAYFFATVKR